mmetsp:Transcript_51300/g.83226  ORF Transcript_51300/g.83226 Transcript_51300/m.83226 type:complete len:95 (+) Transcript_51300:151-435(+)
MILNRELEAIVQAIDSGGQRLASPITAPEKSPENVPFHGQPKPPRVKTHEAKEVRKHHEPARSAGRSGLPSRAMAPTPSGAKTKPKIPPAVAPL